MNKKVELLAPAGSIESLKAAVNAGADAVYIGGGKFGARAAAKSVDTDDIMLFEAINYAHRFGVNVYLTVNTLMKEDEIDTLYDYLYPFYINGIDAVIVQDIGAVKFIHEHFPDIDIHISTQMSITGPESVNILKKYGIVRIVTARELSKEEISTIYNETNIEIESFIHGALCYSYSGQCLMSSLIGGRSGNRGRCAQTCRLDYDVKSENKLLSKNKTVLSCKDISAIDILPDILNAHVYSLKIEGRMKSPIYTAGVVSIWRKYLDLYLLNKKDYVVADKDRYVFKALFDRGGYSEGYYNTHNSKNMIAINGKPQNRIVDEELNAYITKKYIENDKKINVRAKFIAKKNEDLYLELSVLNKDNDKNIYNIKTNVIYDKAYEAQNRAISKEDIIRKLDKTGGTCYKIIDFDIDIEDNLFINLSSLNEIKRLALNKLDNLIINKYNDRKTIVVLKKKNNLNVQNAKIINIVIEEIEQLNAVIEYIKNNKQYANNIQLSLDAICCTWLELEKKIKVLKELNIKVGLLMPHIYRLEARSFFERFKEKIISLGFSFIIIRNLEEIDFANIMKENGCDIYSDYTIYGMNYYARQFLIDEGISRLTLPVELNIKELQQLLKYTFNDELIIYGRLSMMVSAQCIKKTTTGCDKKTEILYLTDRTNSKMIVKNRCEFCYNSILNAKILSTLGISEKIKKLPVNTYRLWFTNEKFNDVLDVLDAYFPCFIDNKNVPEFIKDFTRGHFNRGIE